MPLEKNIIPIPFGQGLDTKTGEFHVAAGKALKLENARFVKAGVLSKRFGGVLLSTDTSEGTTIQSNDIKALVADSKMVNAITGKGVFAFSSANQRWEKLSEMKDMVKIKSDFVSKSAYNHFNPDLDLEPVTGSLAMVYREVQENNGLTPSPAEFLTIVLEDLATGVKKIKRVGTGNTSYQKSQQKVVVTLVSGKPRITVFYSAGTYNLSMLVLDEDLEFVTPATVLDTYTLANALWMKQDICKDGSNIFHATLINNQLKLRKLSLSGAVVSTSTVTLVHSLARDASNTYGLGFSICLSSTELHVFFISPGELVIGVGFSKNLALIVSETEGDTLGASCRELSVVHDGTKVVLALTQSPQPGMALTFKITAFHGADYSFVIDPFSFVPRSVIISRPFVVNGSNYVVCKCPESLQSTGLVLNLDNFKFVTAFSPFDLSLDRIILSVISGGTCNVVVHNSEAILMVEKSYGVNTNSILTFDFNATIAAAKIRLDFAIDLGSGTRAKVGNTSYYTNGVTFALDGRGACESGFNLSPLIKAATGRISGAATPAIASKTFKYICVYEFYNGKGEIERSIPSPAVSVTTLATATYIELEVKNYVGTFKKFKDENGSTSYTVDVVAYRNTSDNGTTFYRVSSVPSSDADTVLLYDAAADNDIRDNAQLYSTGGVLESDSTPNAKFSTAGGDRLFLGGLEVEDEIAFSKKQLFEEAVSFSSFFRIRISSGTNADKSKISALGYLDGKLIIFRENSLYYIAGDGPLETGVQDSFTKPEVISSDTGCPFPRSVVNIPAGILFKSNKGIYLLDRSFQVSYLGAPVEDFNSEGIVSALISDKFNEARFFTDQGNCLVYNYLFNEWTVFKGQTSIDADVWNGSQVQVISTGILKEVKDSYLVDGIPYSLSVKTGWLKLAGLQGFQRVWKILILGKFKSAHNLQIKVAYDNNSADVDTYSITPLITDKQYQYEVHLTRQKCQSIQIEITDTSPVGESMDLSEITIECGLKRGANKLASSRRAV